MAARYPASNVWYAQDLLRRVHDHDEAAFGELYERYSPRVYNYLRSHLDGRTQEAEDLTSEVFTRVYEKIHGYEFRGLPLSAWLFRIAHNRLVDHVRSRPRQAAVPLDVVGDLQETASAYTLNRQLTADQIAGALTRLTEDQRRVIQLRFLEGLSLAQTAQAMDKGEEAVKKLQSRGLAALKRSLDCRSGCWRIGTA